MISQSQPSLRQRDARTRGHVEFPESAASPRRRIFVSLLLLVVALAFIAVGCSRQSGPKQGVRPRTLRDVPAQRLAYHFTPDTDAPPSAAAAEDANAKLPSIQNDFDTRRQNDALVRTVLSPDRMRALAIYVTGEDQPNEFRIDLYGADGSFLRRITPEGFAVIFDSMVAWSPDGNNIAFIALKSGTAQPTPTPFADIMPEEIPGLPSQTPTPVAPAFSLVPLFSTEQIYICNRDGYDLKPLTTRDGLIYFYLAWAPDSHALVSLACRESEWRDRPLRPIGRPRLIDTSGGERLLDDALTDVLPVWSPDASKVVTAFETAQETNVKIYDALGEPPTQATIALREPLLAASRAYDEKEARKNKKSAETKEPAPSSDKRPDSFNPIVALEWPQPETLFVQTGYVRDFDNGQVRTFMRWHTLRLSAQAALLSQRRNKRNITIALLR